MRSTTPIQKQRQIDVGEGQLHRRAMPRMREGQEVLDQQAETLAIFRHSLLTRLRVVVAIIQRSVQQHLDIAIDDRQRRAEFMRDTLATNSRRTSSRSFTLVTSWKTMTAPSGRAFRPGVKPFASNFRCAWSRHLSR